MHRVCGHNLEMVVQWISAHLSFLPLHILAKYSAGKGSFAYIKLQCIWLAINQPLQKLVGVVAATVEIFSLQQKLVSQWLPTSKANRSNLSSSLRLRHQLQASICKCKRWSYSCSARLPSNTLAAWGQALFLMLPLLLLACSPAQDGDQRVELEWSLLNLWPYVTDRRTNVILGYFMHRTWQAQCLVTNYCRH